MISLQTRRHKSKQTFVQMIKLGTRTAAWMYLTNFGESTLQDVITELEPDLLQTGPSIILAQVWTAPLRPFPDC